MWQHVISFDNAWLEKYENYNQETHELYAEAVMKATRSAMTELMYREGIDNAMKEIRPLLGDFSFTYLSKYKTDDLKQCNELFDKAVSFYKESYG